MGCVKYFNKKYYESLSLLSEAIEIHSLNCSYWLYRALSYFQIHSYPESLRDINTAIALGRILKFYNLIL